MTITAAATSDCSRDRGGTTGCTSRMSPRTRLALVSKLRSGSVGGEKRVPIPVCYQARASRMRIGTEVVVPLGGLTPPSCRSCRAYTRKPGLSGVFLGAALPDSNRRPLPYHGSPGMCRDAAQRAKVPAYTQESSLGILPHLSAGFGTVRYRVGTLTVAAAA